jgi:cell filamentation protein
MSDHPYREQLEAFYTRKRIAGLLINPDLGKGKGRFDVACLQEIHRYIFQDLPKHGITNPPPGEFRPPVSDGRDWHKNRALASVDDVSVVCYSPMDKGTINRLTQMLTAVSPAILSKLETPAFIEYMGKLYAELDYIHPFYEGNSRTLRTFTYLLAQESGYVLDWGRFNKNARLRDQLYIARDRAVGELAMPHIRDIRNLRSVVFCMDKYEANPGLLQLLQGAIFPAGQG